MGGLFTTSSHIYHKKRKGADVTHRFITFLNKGSVARQIGVAVFIIFSVMMLFNAFVVRHNAQTTLRAEVTNEIIQINKAYFNSLHTLMTTGTMDQREQLRSQLMQAPNIIDARVIRGDLVTVQYGPGLPSERSIDKIDKQALQGKEITQLNKKNDQSILTVALPYRAISSTGDMNCLQCHDVPNGTVNGAIRIDYSLEHSNAAIARSVWESIAVNFIVLLVGIALLALYMNRNLTRGIREADVFAAAIAGQNMDAETPAIRRDNLGRLMYSMIKMRDALKAQFTEIQKNAEHEREEMKSKIEQQQKESNLVVAFESGIVNIVTSLSDIAAEAGDSASLLSKVSSQVNQNSSTALSGTDHVLQQVANTSHSTIEINKVFKDINQRSQDATMISELAMEDTSATSRRMESLQLASDNIGSVISTITEIAEKTNLLALNASIEAARAGEVGRGFSVVANEVKSLANQTRRSTEIITKQIKDVQSECRDAITAIEGISQVIIRMNKHTHDVAEIMSQYTDTLNTLETNAETTDYQMKSVHNSVNIVSQAAEESENISTTVAMYCKKIQDISLEHAQLVGQFMSMLQGIRNNDTATDAPHDEDVELF